MRKAFVAVCVFPIRRGCAINICGAKAVGVYSWRTRNNDVVEHPYCIAHAIPQRDILTFATYCGLCGTALHDASELGLTHGLGECVAVCETCGGTGDGERQIEPDPYNEPCASCHGVGGIPMSRSAHSGK